MSMNAYLTLTLFLGEIADTELEKKVDVDGNRVIDFKDVALIMQKFDACGFSPFFSLLLFYFYLSSPFVITIFSHISEIFVFTKKLVKIGRQF